MNKIIYGIMETHLKRELTNFSLSTWIKNIKNLYIFTDKENLEDKRFIKITDNDNYLSNTPKCIFGLKYMFEENKDADFFVFMDNDTYMNFSNMEKFLSSKDPNELKAYGSILNHWPDDKSLFYLSGGAGFVITRKSMLKLYEVFEKEEKDFNEEKNGYADVTVGLHMRDIGIEIINSDLFHSQPPEFYVENLKFSDSISYHYLNTIDKMKKIIN